MAAPTDQLLDARVVQMSPSCTSAELGRRLARVPEVEFAVVYGSRSGSSERLRADSDWDIGVYLKGDLDAWQRFKLRLRLLAELEDLGQIDLVILNGAPALLAHRAVLGQPLFVRDRAVWVKFFVRSIAMSEDERYWREFHRKARLQRAREGRFGRP